MASLAPSLHPHRKREVAELFDLVPSGTPVDIRA